MSKEGILNGKIVLAVAEGQETIDAIEEVLEMCIVDKAYTFNEASQFLLSYNYDLVVTDMAGANNFELLKIATARDFPTIILTNYAIKQHVQEESIKLGAISLLYKEKMPELVQLFEDILSDKGRS